MLGTPTIRNLIREGKTAKMVSTLQTGGVLGMQTVDQHLGRLVRQQAIHAEAAHAISPHPEQYPM